MFLHIRNIYLKQLGSSVKQFVLRKIYMSFPWSLEKSIHHTAADPVIWICMYTNTWRNGVCNFKANSRDIICQTIGILLKHTVYWLTIFLIYLCSKIQRNAIFLQKHHGFSHICLLSHLYCNLSGFLLTDSLDFRQPFRFFFHYSKGILAKTPHNSGSKCCTYPLNRSGTQITFHSLGVLWCLFRIRLDIKLSAVYMVLGKLSLSFNGHALCNVGKCSYTGQLFLWIRGLKDHNCISIFIIAEYDMIYIACNFLTHLFFSCRQH